MKYNGIKIYKRTDGRWEAKKQINGNRISICRNTQAEVYEEIKNLFPKSEPTKISKITTFFDYIDFWLEKYKKPFMKKKRIFNYESVIKHQIKPYFKDINMQNFTIAEINLAIKNIPNTRQKEDATQIIKNIFKQAYRDKKIKFDIYNEITKYQHKREEGKALTLEQRKILIEKSKLIENGEIFVFYLFTGARASEILNINPTTDITKDMIHLPGTKTDLSDRWVPILKPIKEILKKKDLTQNKLFTISYRTLQKRVDKLRELCRWHLNIKDLRTTFGTMLAEMGIQKNVIARWMGHTTTRTTEKYYIKILPEFEKNQVEKLNKVFDDTSDDTFSSILKINEKFNQYLVDKNNKICYILIYKSRK